MFVTRDISEFAYPVGWTRTPCAFFPTIQDLIWYFSAAKNRDITAASCRESPRTGKCSTVKIQDNLGCLSNADSMVC